MALLETPQSESAPLDAAAELWKTPEAGLKLKTERYKDPSFSFGAVASGPRSSGESRVQELSVLLEPTKL